MFIINVSLAGRPALLLGIVYFQRHYSKRLTIVCVFAATDKYLLLKFAIRRTYILLLLLGTNKLMDIIGYGVIQYIE